jgi:hypothetical protein
MACMAALVGASVAIGAPSAALSRSSASSVICSSSSSFNPVFLRNRSFHGTTVRLGATKPGLTFSSFVILCWEPPAQMMMAFSSIILSMVAYCILRCSLVSNIPPPPPPPQPTPKVSDSVNFFVIGMTLKRCRIYFSFLLSW